MVRDRLWVLSTNAKGLWGGLDHRNIILKGNVRIHRHAGLGREDHKREGGDMEIHTLPNYPAKSWGPTEFIYKCDDDRMHYRGIFSLGISRHYFRYETPAI